MSKKMDEMRKKPKKDLEKEIQKTIEEVERMIVESKINPQKDTNAIYKKKKHVARLKTLLSSVTE